MKIHEFAESILFGENLTDKLILAPRDLDFKTLSSPLKKTPREPVRHSSFSKIEKTVFPKESSLSKQESRGVILHFFANHELLALELMALCLLKFPEADEAFKRGLVGIMVEEQNHLKLYLKRMKELGVNFGDVGMNLFFWNHLKHMKSPLDFVTQMSLTFEQANLDFSRHYRDLMTKAGDPETALVLNQVYEEEIRHVKHGVKWFNEWRNHEDGESEWQAYLKLLPFPLTASRAKGIIFDVGAREKAGLTRDFIESLQVCEVSKGRVPEFFVYTPFVEAEVSQPSNFSPKKIQSIIKEDLSFLMTYLCRAGDLLFLEKLPSTPFLKKLKEAEIPLPHFITNLNEMGSHQISGFSPWGMSGEVSSRFSGLRERFQKKIKPNALFQLSQLESYNQELFSKLYSKAFSASMLVELLSQTKESEPIFGSPDELFAQVLETPSQFYETIEKARTRKRSLMLKAPYGTSGNQVKRLDWNSHSPSLFGWAENTIGSQKSLVSEPYLDKIHDLSVQVVIETSGPKLLETRIFYTDSQNQYLGTLLDSSFSSCLQEVREFIYEKVSGNKTRLDHFQTLIRKAGERIHKEGYRGPVGVDALIYRGASGKLGLKPIIEINPRFTLGRVALALEKRIHPKTTGVFLLLRVKDLERIGFKSKIEFFDFVDQNHALQFLSIVSGEKRLESGIFFATDREVSGHFYSLLGVGNESIQCLKNWLERLRHPHVT